MDAERLIESLDEIELDPVCGEGVDLEAASERDLVIEFEGRDYAFCTPACRRRFEHEPKTFATAGRGAP